MSVLLLCSLAFVANLVLAPDPARNLYYRAQGLEAKGLLEQALLHYDLVVKKSDSPYAPRALQQQGDILAGLARRTGDQERMRQAIAIYLHLADRYQDNPLAGEALFAAGRIATNDLRDAEIARRAYEAVRERYPNNRGYVSEATLRLGRVELMEGHGKEAQTLLQNVLQQYSNFPEHCAEAQYHLGVVYETILKKAQWAQNAYKATIERYPRSVWAQNAEERLGMLIYGDYMRRPNERRVQIEVPALPEEGEGDSPYAALKPLLAAYGLEVGSATLRGWSLEPFYAGFVTGNPSRAVRADFDDFHNVLAAAGLRYANKQSKDAKIALQNLQDELDGGHPPLIYNGRWRLVTGYDSMRDQVFLQNRGAAFEVVSVKDFSPGWQRRSSEGAFTILSIRAPGSNPKAKILPAAGASPQPTPQASAQPSTVSTAPSLLSSPVWTFQLPPLSLRAAHRRTVLRAADLMSRSREDNSTLLNLEALEAIAKELDRLATSPTIGDGASPLTDPMDEPARRDSDLLTGATVQPTPTAMSRKAPANALARTRALLSWFQTPLQSWVGARRDAAAYLDIAAGSLGQSALRRAAENFRTSIAELEQAAASIPSASSLSDDGRNLSETARNELSQAARHVAAARAAERRAVAAMNEVG